MMYGLARFLSGQPIIKAFKYTIRNFYRTHKNLKNEDTY